jgi:hypothetical protein
MIKKSKAVHSRSPASRHELLVIMLARKKVIVVNE